MGFLSIQGEIPQSRLPAPATVDAALADSTRALLKNALENQKYGSNQDVTTSAPRYGMDAGGHSLFLPFAIDNQTTVGGTKCERKLF
jgi:hypothetical protein